MCKFEALKEYSFQIKLYGHFKLETKRIIANIDKLLIQYLRLIHTRCRIRNRNRLRFRRDS